MSTGESIFKTPEQQREASQQQIDKKKAEVGSWIPGRRDLRVNLDALQVDRRQKQIEATLDSAKNASDFTIGLKQKERQDVEFILRSNSLRLLEQMNGSNHTAGALDRFVKRLFKKNTEQPREKLVFDKTNTSVRRDVAEFFRNDPQAAAVFGKDGLGSEAVSESDKAMLLRNVQELFKGLGTSSENPVQREASIALRAQISQDIARALPRLSPALQEQAMVTMASLEQHHPYDSNQTTNVDSLSQSQFLDTLTPESFASLDEEAKIRFLKNVKLDAYTAFRLSQLLSKEKNRAIHEVAFSTFAKVDPNTSPDSGVSVSYGVYNSEWKDVPQSEKTKLHSFYNEQVIVNALRLPMGRNTGYGALKALDGFADKAGLRFTDVLEKTADVYSDYARLEGNVDESIFLSAPGYYLEKWSSQSGSKKEDVQREFLDVARLNWQRIAGLIEKSATTTADQLEPLVSALEQAKKVFSKMAPDKSFITSVGNYDRQSVINRLKGRVGRGNQQLASRLDKVFSR